MKPRKLFERISSGSLNNVGFDERGSRGSHRFFARPGVAELLNLQPMNGKAKPYQVRQFLQLVGAYHLGLEE